jgi:site-specific DNA recombinase
MNALFLKELAEKTRRGLRGRIELGKAGGGVSFGYRIVRRLENGVVTTGEREIMPDEAAVVRRIFNDYRAGASPKQIAKALNAEGVRGPRGALWSPSTIHGNPERGIGILHNELYIGRLVWNRQRFLKDPDTGKRVARTNPLSEWITKDVPALRIIDDEVWQAVQARYASVQRKWKAGQEGRRFNQFRRPKYLFSGLTKCGECGAGFIVYSREQLGCFGTRDRGTCTNKLTISRHEVEERVLSALQDKLMRKDFFEEFCREFAKEMNRLRMEQRAGLTSAKREVERIGRRIKKLLDLMLDDEIAVDEAKTEMKALDSRRKELETQLRTVDEPPPLLHPSMADLYRSKVEELAAALQREDTRLEASEMLRGLIDSIVLTPEKGQLRIELRGNLAAMLTAAQQAKRSPETGDLLVPVQLVAGGGFEPPTFGL